MAAELRRRAESVEGAERENLLWIAEEWEKLAARDEPGRRRLLQTAGARISAALARELEGA
jgi:hypothetical protein